MVIAMSLSNINLQELPTEHSSSCPASHLAPGSPIHFLLIKSVSTFRPDFFSLFILQYVDYDHSDSSE